MSNKILFEIKLLQSQQGTHRKNYDQNMTIFDPKLRLKYDWYVKIETINVTFRIHEKD